MTAVEGMYGGLNALADLLQIDRIGPVHQAGSDSLLTAQTYFTLVSKHMSGICDDTKFRGELFGLGTNHTKYKAKNYVSNGNQNGNNGNGNTNTNSNSNTTITSSTSTSHLSSPQQSQLQYYTNVHYPSQQVSHHGSGGYGYSEEFPEY